jgi:hypothetical protein
MKRNNLARHNMVYGILHGAFFQMGTAFADPYAVLPLFLAGFTGSRAIIGLVVSLTEAMSVLPQITRSRGYARPAPSLGPGNVTK